MINMAFKCNICQTYKGSKARHKGGQVCKECNGAQTEICQKCNKKYKFSTEWRVCKACYTDIAIRMDRKQLRKYCKHEGLF